MELITHSRPWITAADIDAVRAVMECGMISRGSQVEAFEKAVSAYNQTAGCVAVGSGTAALMLALKALDIGAGDEVILPTYVCISVANAVKAVGAVPVLCDVGTRWNMTPELVKPHISEKTRAIIVIHIFGIAADTKSFLQFNLPVIEDCCQAFGAQADGRKVSTAGTIGFFSFNAIKCLTTGEGGMVTSTDAALVGRMRQLRADNSVASPMTDIQAVLGLSQLGRYEQMLSRRREIAQVYFDRLARHYTERLSEVRQNSMFFRFPLIVPGDFDKLRYRLEERGVAVRKGVDALIHRQWNMPDETFKNAVSLFNTTVSLPIYPALTAAETGHILRETGQLL